MAFDISNDNFLEKKKIDLSEELGEGAFVEFREPSKREFLLLQKAYEAGLLEFEDKFIELEPALLVNHGFISGGKPATNEQVVLAISKKTAAQNKVEMEFFAWATAPFQKATESESKA